MGKTENILTKEFFKKVINKAIREAGPKYTHSLEKNAPNLAIEELFFAFEILGRIKKLYAYLKPLAEELEKESHLNYSLHKLIYMRKDLLDRVLQDKKRYLIWGVWGERRYKAKENAGLDEFARKHQSYKVFQRIVTYRDIIAEREAA